MTFSWAKEQIIMNYFIIRVLSCQIKIGEKPSFASYIMILSRLFMKMDFWEFLDGWEFGGLSVGRACPQACIFYGLVIWVNLEYVSVYLHVYSVS